MTDHAALIEALERADLCESAEGDADIMVGQFIARWDYAVDGAVMDADTAQALAREFKRMRELIDGSSLTDPEIEKMIEAAQTAVRAGDYRTAYFKLCTAIGIMRRGIQPAALRAKGAQS